MRANVSRRRYNARDDIDAADGMCEQYDAPRAAIAAADAIRDTLRGIDALEE